MRPSATALFLPTLQSCFFFPYTYFFSLATYAVPNWLSNEAFLQGLGLTQSLPGPLFNFAAYIGAAYKGVAGALLAWVRSNNHSLLSSIQGSL